MTFNYVLHLLGAKSLTALSEDLKDPIYESVDENGMSRYMENDDEEGWD